MNAQGGINNTAANNMIYANKLINVKSLGTAGGAAAVAAQILYQIITPITFLCKRTVLISRHRPITSIREEEIQMAASAVGALNPQQPNIGPKLN